MAEVTIKFERAIYIPPTNRLQYGYAYVYELIHENGFQEKKVIRVFASDVLSVIWQLDFSSSSRDAEKLLLQFAKQQIIEKYKEGTLSDNEEVVLLTSTQPSNRPFDPHILNLTENEQFKIKQDTKSLLEELNENQLAAAIIERRDIINALFASKHKEKLLLLTQERNLLDFFKDAKNEEEYSHRISSLGQVSRHLNIDILRSLTSETDKSVGSVALLDKFLISLNKPSKAISDTLKHIGYIRKGYPVHLDIPDVIKGYKYFKLPYPVKDYSETWKFLLKSYLDSLNSLFDILVETYTD